MKSLKWPGDANLIYECPSSNELQWPDLKMGHHQMETFSALLALCEGNSPVTGELPPQRPVRRSFDIFFDLGLNKRLISDAIASIMHVILGRVITALGNPISENKQNCTGTKVMVINCFRTIRMLSVVPKWKYTIKIRYNTADIFPTTHNTHPLARSSGVTFICFTFTHDGIMICQHFSITGPLCGSLHKASTMQGFDGVFVVSVINPLNKQSKDRWHETPQRSCGVTVMHCCTTCNIVL